uniref:O-antigen ligase-related domain-containing protein n=1 Tax=Fervidobacterium pennivorans TaxID=93466 RepID=A0A7C4W4E5_FERPE
MNTKSNHYICNMSRKQIFEKKMERFIYLYIFLSGFVFIEPSLAELAFSFFLLLYITNVRVDTKIFALSMLLFVPCFLSTYISQTFFHLLNLRFVLIDLYLFFAFTILSSHMRKNLSPTDMINKLMLFWAMSGVINIFAGLLSLKNGGKLFGIEILIYGLRLKGFFKDPNVLGAFLVPPAIFYLSRAVRYKKQVLSFLTFVVLSLGIFFTFSRAAWLNYTISLLLLLLIKLFKPKELKRLFTLLISLSAIAILFWKVSASIEILGVNLQTFFLGRTGLQDYDKERFAAQKEFSNILSSTSLIFGAGPGNYEIFAKMSAHSLYLRYIGERGLFGFLLFLIFLLIIVLRTSRSKYSELLLPLLIGQLVNSLFIDSLHWRHFWVLFSLAFVKKDEALKQTIL